MNFRDLGVPDCRKRNAYLPCGWVKDRFGVSWQIVPDFLWKMDEDDDKDRSQRVMKALYKMNKVYIEKIKEVWDSK